MTDNELMLEAYRLIRIKARNFIDPSNAELAEYVRGVVDLQSILYGKLEPQNNVKKEENV